MRTEARPLRVAHVSNGEFYAGAERVQDILSIELSRLGCKITFVLLKPGQFDRVRRSRSVPGVNLAMAGRADLRVVSRLASLLMRGEFDLMHAHEPRSLLVAAMASWLVGVPFVYHVHSRSRDETESRWRNVANSSIERLFLPRARAVICVSQSLSSRLMWLRRTGTEVHVVHNGVEPQMDAIKPQLARDDWTLGVVALFRPRKGLETLVRAIADLRRRGRRVLLKAVGAFESESYQRRINRLVLELNLAAFITWTGFSSDVRSELNTFDLFVLPSMRGEGMPMAILEAMAAAVPVVSTRVEGIPELIRDGVDGVLVEPGNSVALADCIERFLDGRLDLQRVRESALMRQRTEFSARLMAARVHEIYQQCIPQQRE